MKIMHKIILTMWIFAFSTAATAQGDPSQKLLDKLAKKVKSYKNLYIEYTVIVKNKQTETSSFEDGKITSKGNRFKLTSKSADVYCDGTTQWTYLKEDNEVMISKADSESDDMVSNPVRFLTGKRKDFKYKYTDKVEEDGEVRSEISYFPKDLNTPYSYIKLRFDEGKMQPYSIFYAGKDGVDYTVRLKTYMPDAESPKNEEFVFDPSKYHDIVITDLR
jgi:outer membrane lipoprotein-sorting protein